MTLQERLDSMRAQFEARAPKPALEVMHRAEDELRRSGILDRVLKVGAAAPAFTLPNAEGRPVSSAALLGQGPLVVSFYRGKW